MSVFGGPPGFHPGGRSGLVALRDKEGAARILLPVASRGLIARDIGSAAPSPTTGKTGSARHLPPSRRRSLHSCMAGDIMDQRGWMSLLSSGRASS